MIEALVVLAVAAVGAFVSIDRRLSRLEGWISALRDRAG